MWKLNPGNLFNPRWPQVSLSGGCSQGRSPGYLGRVRWLLGLVRWLLALVRWLVGQNRWLVDEKRTDFGEEPVQGRRGMIAITSWGHLRLSSSEAERKLSDSELSVPTDCTTTLKIIFSAHCLYCPNFQSKIFRHASVSSTYPIPM